MRRSETIGLVTLILIGVTALGLGRYVAETIERRAATEAREKLDSVGFPEITIIADGSVIALSGRVRSERDHDVILRTMAALDSQPELLDNIVVVAPLVDLQPAVMQIQKENGAYTMSGDAPNPEARDLLVARAERSSGGGAFINVMDAQDRRAEDEWMRAAEAAIDAVAKLRRGEVSVEPGLVRIVGAAGDAERKAEIEDALRAAIAPSFRLEIDIASPPPLLSPYVFTARNSEGGFEISNCAAPDAAQRSVILGALRARDLMAERQRAEACIIANGAPNSAWALAIERSIAALVPLTEGEVRIVDDKVSLIGYVDKGADIDAAVAVASADWPAGYSVDVDIREVLPVVSPFALTAVKMPGEVRLSGYAPSRERSEAWAALLDATNTLALARGAPAGWSQAVTVVIEELAKMKVGAATISDRDIRLAAPGDVSERTRLETRIKALLPSGYRLSVVEAKAPSTIMADAAAATITTSDDVDTSSYTFLVQRRLDGTVVLRGVVGGPTDDAVIGAYARAKLGGSAMETAFGVSDTPAPDGWQRAIFAGLEALGYLDAGELAVESGGIFLRGSSQSAADARRAGAALAEKTPGGFTRFSRIDIVETRPKSEEDESGPPLESGDCVAALNVAVQEDPIRFESGSAAISGESDGALDRIAMILRRCPLARIEIGGHTDALGSDEMNMSLSAQRAEAVRLSLIARLVSRDQITAKGYGEDEPIASNETNEGRIKNRRIEFKLLGNAG